MIDNLEPLPEEAQAGAPGQPVAGDRYVHIKVHDGDYDRIRTREFGKGVVARIGWKSGRSEVISLLFDKTRYTASQAREWYRTHKDSLASVASTEASTYVPSERLDVSPESLGFDVPEPTLSKAYALFRLLSFFPVINERRDTFDEADVNEDVVETLRGSPIYGNVSLTDHFNPDGTRGPQVGSVLEAKRHDDAIYALAAIYKDELTKHYGIDATDLPEGFSVSMEVKFDPEATRYLVDGDVLTRPEAVFNGVASPLAVDDNPRRYEARFLVPLEYHAVALLHRGRNADPSADVLLAVASDTPAEEQPMPDLDLIEWHEEDFTHFVEVAESLGAVLTSKERGKLGKGQFAYVDDDGRGHLPIHDKAHSKNAWARLNQADIPESAKRGAAKKILAALRRFGVEPDKSSPAYKAYAALHHHTPEEREKILEMLRKRKRKATAKASVDTHVITTEGLSVYFMEDQALYRADFAIDADTEDFVLAETVELGPIPPSNIGEQPMNEQELKEAIERARAEAAATARADAEQSLEARKAEIANAAVEAYRNSEELRGVLDESAKTALAQYRESDEFKSLVTDTATQAVETYKGSEEFGAVKAEAVEQYKQAVAAIAARMKELESIHPFKDDAERTVVEDKVSETIANEVEWLKLRSERLEAALASATKRIPTTTKASVPTLVATATLPERNLFDLTDEESE